MDETSPEVARAEIDRLRSSEEIKNVMHPSHERALQHLAEMYARAYPEPETPEQTTPTEQPGNTDDPLGVPQAELEGLASLRQEWGPEFDSRLQQAQGVAAEFAKAYGNEFVGWMESSRAGSNPLVVKAFASWAKGEAGPDVSPAEARELVKLLRAGEYYGRADSRMHDVLHAVITKLYQIGFNA